MKEVKYWISSCSAGSEVAAMNPMKPYDREDAIEIIKEEGGTAYVLASDYELMLAKKISEIEDLKLELLQSSVLEEYLEDFRNSEEN